MLSIGVQTKGIVADRGEIAGGFQKIAKAGFTKVDFNLDDFLKNHDVYSGRIQSIFNKEVAELVEIFQKYKQAMDEAGLMPSQMHAPYPIYVPGQPQATQYMQGSVIPKSIIIAEVLGIPWTVMHPFKLQYTHGKEYEKTANLEYFQMLIPLLKQCRVKVCLENLYEGVGTRITEGVCADPEEAIWYIDTLNAIAEEELFGFCLDTGHLQLVKRDPYEFIKKLGSRIKAVHLHENDGENDVHQLPFTFAKGMEWEKVWKGLKEVGFAGTLSFETFPAMGSFPYNTSDAVLKLIHDVGEYMVKQIEDI